MASSKNYEGAAPLTMARTKAGGYVYIYAGEPVSDDVDSADLKRLVDEGFLVEKAAEDTDDDGPPAKSASKADWVAYATDEARGDQQLSEEEAKALTRDQLVERYYGQS